MLLIGSDELFLALACRYESDTLPWPGNFGARDDANLF
jgi:hypothetical protein